MTRPAAKKGRQTQIGEGSLVRPRSMGTRRPITHEKTPRDAPSVTSHVTHEVTPGCATEPPPPRYPVTSPAVFSKGASQAGVLLGEESTRSGGHLWMEPLRGDIDR